MRANQSERDAEENFGFQLEGNSPFADVPEDEEWESLAAEDFFRGYVESDAIYDDFFEPVKKKEL